MSAAEQTAERILTHVRDNLPAILDEQAIVECVRQAYQSAGGDLDAEAEAQAAAVVADVAMRLRLGRLLGFLDQYH